MNGNIRTMILVSLLFGYATGAYEVLFPLYLDWIGVSFTDMGILFGITAAVIAGLTVLIGSQSDVRGRKLFYSISLAVSSLVNFFVPFFRSLWQMLVLSIGNSSSTSTRSSVHNVLLFELTRKRFLAAYSIVNGAEYFFQAIGILGAGLILAASSFNLAFWASSMVVAVGFLLFVLSFHEERPEVVTENQPKGTGPYLPKELIVFSISGLVMAIGFGCSHGFMTPLFFVKRFGVDDATLSVILTVHRLSFGLPLIFADRVIGLLKRLPMKALMILLMLYQGLSIAATALVSDLFFAAVVWVSHDLLAAAYWTPIQSALIQSYCRENSRGADSNKVSSIGSIGSIAAPFIAGILASINITYPFIASGLITVLAALILVFV